jgi:hypothetical protein
MIFVDASMTPPSAFADTSPRKSVGRNGDYSTNLLRSAFLASAPTRSRT